MDEKDWSRFDDKWVPEPNTGCWLWFGTSDGDGYGVFKGRRGRMHKAHRLAYERGVGPIAAGMTIDHLCRQKCCVNPAHMEPVTFGENARRAKLYRTRASACKRGHAMEGDNLYIPPRKARRGWGADCRECRRMRTRKANEKVRLSREASRIERGWVPGQPYQGKH